MTRIPTIVALCAAGLLVSAGCTAPTVRTAGVEAVGLRKTCDLRSVYQVKTDEWKEGVARGSTTCRHCSIPTTTSVFPTPPPTCCPA